MKRNEYYVARKFALIYKGFLSIDNDFYSTIVMMFLFWFGKNVELPIYNKD